MAFFKVVATREKRGVYFSAIPQNWERNKILYWPSHLTRSQRELLRENAESMPEDNWEKFSCLLKFSSICNFETALAFEKQLSQCTDTEAEEELLCKTTANIISNNHDDNSCSSTDGSTEKQNETVINRNHMLLNLNPSNSEPSCSNYTKGKGKLLIQSNFNTDNLLGDETLSNNILYFADDNGDIISNAGTREDNSNMDEIRKEINTIKEEMCNMKMTFSSSMREVLEQYAKITVTLDNIYFVLNERVVGHSISSKDLKEQDFLGKFKFPLMNIEDIEEFDLELKTNVDFKKQMIQVYSQVCGKNGEEDGVKAAYRIADAIFSPNILLQYTWTGISREKSVVKKPFQNYVNIVQFFFQILVLADNRFTIQKTKNVFKDNILKHAKKRSARKKRNISKQFENSEDDEAEIGHNEEGNVNMRMNNED